MTSIEVPYSIAAALPTLSVMDITNEVARTVSRSERPDGIAYIHTANGLTLVRVQERETGFFEDVEALLERVVPAASPSRERLVASPPRPAHRAGAVHRTAHSCLGQWQRILLFSLDSEHRNDWSLTLLA